MKPLLQISKLTLLLLLASAPSASAFYDPALGRWINRDPIGERGGNCLYRFLKNTLPNAVDPFGLHPVHGSFPTENDAAIAAMDANNPRSIADNLEHCGLICKDLITFDFFYTERVEEPTACHPGRAPCPSCSVRVGDWHTHGGGDEIGDNVPSPEDIISCDRNETCYLATPNGSFIAYYHNDDGHLGTLIYLRRPQ